MSKSKRAASAGRAILYLRRSKESTAKTVSLAAQEAACRRYAAELGFTVVATLTHDGISGGKRSRFEALDKHVSEHGASKVVCYSLDRTARDAAGLLDWLDNAARRGVELWECGRGQRETASAAGYLGVGVEGLMAAHYRLVIGEKTADALAHLRATGRVYTRLAPYGFANVDGRLVEVPSEQAAIAQARRLQSSGLSLRRISVELAARGMMARTGRTFGPQLLANVLEARGSLQAAKVAA